MPAASIFIQPQKLRRAALLDGSAALVDDLLALAARLTADQAKGGEMFVVFGEAMEAVTGRMVARANLGMANARQRLKKLMQPLLDGFQGVGSSVAEADDGIAIVRAILELLGGLAEGAGNLTIEHLRGPLTEALDIIDKDFGLTGSFIEEQVWALIDDLIDRLEKIPPESDPVVRDNRRAAISVLRRVNRQMRNEFTFPHLSADTIAGALLSWLRRSGIERVTKKIACVGKEAGKGVTALEDILKLVPTFSFGTRSVGAAEAAPARKEFCWYATWLLGDKDTDALKRAEIEYPTWILAALPFGTSKDKIWFDRAAKTIYKGDKIIAQGVDEWKDLRSFNRYSFKHFEPDTLEKWAFGSAVAGNILEAILHLVSLEEGDYSSNSVNAAMNTFLTIYEIVRKEPLNGTIEWLPGRLLLTLLASLEGMPKKGNRFWMWVTLVGPDLVEMVIYNSLAGSARDFLLSSMTLLNFDAPVRHEPFPDETPDDRPMNRKEIEGVANIFVALFTKFLVLSMPKKEYCPPYQSGEQAARMFLLWELLGRIGFGLMGGFVGTVAAEIVAWGEDWPVLGRKMLMAPIQVWNPLTFWPALYMDKEGDTDGGKYNPSGTEFKGYPDAKSSPYTLPYVKGLSCYVVQGNQGFWSHNFINNSQIYAYDFSLDQDEEILCSRPGTVVDFFDWVPNDEKVLTSIPSTVVTVTGETTSERWNFICIRHDVDDSGAPVSPDKVHDLGAGGAESVTFAVYGHGRTGSVRQLFATRRGIPLATIKPSDIIGQKIKRGEPIMLAGNTGISFHNHLHMQVQVEKLPREGGPAAPVANAVRNTNFTIPYVFKDVTNFLGTDGVPKHFNFYTSSTVRVP